MNDRPVNQEVNLTFFKPSGKYYTSGKAIVNHFLFEDEYKQDIVNTQNGMSQSWIGSFYVVVSSDDNAVGFHEALFMPHEFVGMVKR